MEMSDDLKNCLSNYEVQDLINNNNYTQLYSYIISSGLIKFYPTVGELTQLLLAVNINPLNYMDYIPAAYLAWTKISHFTIPKHITSIGTFAFLYCKSLKSIIIPNNVTQIGHQAFGECNALTSITFGKNLKEVSVNILKGTEVKSINYNNTMENWKKIDISVTNTNLFRCTIHCIDGDLKYNEQTKEWEKI